MITVWPFEPNSADPLVEEYGYLTDVIDSEDGNEQRISLRRHPIGSVEFSYRAGDRWEAQRMNAMLFRKHARLWAVPLWHYGIRMTADVAIGSQEILAVTAFVPFTDPNGLGEHALIWRSSASFEVIKLAGIHATSLDLSKPLDAAWPKVGTWILPMRLARLGRVYEMDWETSLCVAGRIKFAFEAWSDGTIVPTVGDQFLAGAGVTPAIE